MEVNIKKYATFFHDGDVRVIEHINDEIILTMESAQLRPEWNEDHITLSKRETISGKLRIFGVRKVVENNKNFLKKFTIKETYDDGNIYTFKVVGNQILLEIWWVRYLPEYEEYGTFRYDIEAEKITWENIPSLSDEYWESLEKDVEE